MSLPWGVRTLVFHQINPVIRSADMIDGGTAHHLTILALPALAFFSPQDSECH
jgi:hypothetical protein